MHVCAHVPRRRRPVSVSGQPPHRDSALVRHARQRIQRIHVCVPHGPLDALCVLFGWLEAGQRHRDTSNCCCCSPGPSGAFPSAQHTSPALLKENGRAAETNPGDPTLLINTLHWHGGPLRSKINTFRMETGSGEGQPELKKHPRQKKHGVFIPN